MANEEYKDYQQCLNKAHQEIVALNQKLCHARRNLEDEKRKRRVIEYHKNILENRISTVREMLFKIENISISKEIKEKLQILVKHTVEIKRNNLYDQDKQNNRHQPAITETDSTGSILSDLNCLSKSEDDLDTDAIIRAHKQKEGKTYEPSSNCSAANIWCNTLDKVAEFNSPKKALTARVKPYTRPFAGQVTLNKQDIDSKLKQIGASMNHSCVPKITIKQIICCLCNKRIKFGKTALRCRHCSIYLHAECKIEISLVPCVREN